MSARHEYREQNSESERTRATSVKDATASWLREYAATTVVGDCQCYRVSPGQCSDTACMPVRSSSVWRYFHAPCTHNRRWIRGVLDFHVGIDGSIWLLQPPSGPTGMQYWRVDKDGRILPPVALDAGLRILRVSRDHVWVVKEDADGVPTIQIRNVTTARR